MSSRRVVTEEHLTARQRLALDHLTGIGFSRKQALRQFVEIGIAHHEFTHDKREFKRLHPIVGDV